MKRNPNGLFFKFFQESLNVKRLSRKLVFFTIVKVLEELSLRWQFTHFLVQIDQLQKRSTPANHDWKSSPGYHFILFWALETKSYKKGPFGFFFHFHSDSVNMNDTKLTFNGLVELNTERPSFGDEPLLSQVREIYENGLILG